MKKSDQELFKWFEQRKKESKAVLDTKKYDIVLVDKQTRKIVLKTVWKSVSYDRAVRLCDRVQREFGDTDEVCIVPEGSSLGQQVA